VYSYSFKPSYLAEARRLCKKKGVPVVAVVSGNPFPLLNLGLNSRLNSGGYDALVMSFSNTPLSLEFLAKAASGVFVPRLDDKLLPVKR
jgi:hypothetical protein